MQNILSGAFIRINLAIIDSLTSNNNFSIVILGHFASVFPSQESNSVSNPFGSSTPWTSQSNMTNANGPSYVNPFQSIDPLKMNGISYNFPASSVPVPPVGNGAAWTPNPFKVKLFCTEGGE